MTPNLTAEAVRKYLSGSTFPVKHFKPICEKYLRMEEVLENISSGKGCPLHQCGLWAGKALSFDPLNENSI